MKVDRDKENIDSDFFLHYLTTCLIPCMGKFAKGEENSILSIDNASILIHNHIEIRNLIVFIIIILLILSLFYIKNDSAYYNIILLYFTRNATKVAQPENCDTTGPNGK